MERAVWQYENMEVKVEIDGMGLWWRHFMEFPRPVHLETVLKLLEAQGLLDPERDPTWLGYYDVSVEPMEHPWYMPGWPKVDIKEDSREWFFRIRRYLGD